MPRRKTTATPLHPKLFFAIGEHLCAAFRTSVSVPRHDSVASALQTESSRLTVKRRCDITNHAANDNILNRLAIRAVHRFNPLTEKTFVFVNVNAVGTSVAFIFSFPRHADNIAHTDGPPSCNRGACSHIPCSGVSVRESFPGEARVFPIRHIRFRNKVAR